MVPKGSIAPPESPVRKAGGRVAGQEESRMLIRTIERFLRENRMAATKFGRLAANDPRFVLDLRMGREPRRALTSRVEHFMNTYSETVHVQ